MGYALQLTFGHWSVWNKHTRGNYREISNYGHVLHALSYTHSLTQASEPEVWSAVCSCTKCIHEHHFLQTTIIASMPIMVNKMARVDSVETG